MTEPVRTGAPGDELPYRVVRPYRVRFDEAIADNTVRTAVFLAWIADIAWQHSTNLGFDREWYSGRGLTWLVRAVRLDVLRPVTAYSRVFAATQVRGYRRIAARRLAEILDPDGELLARAEIDWVMTNDKGVPTRIPDEMYGFVPEGSPSFEMLKVELPETPPAAAAWRSRVARRDLDPLDHVNNSVYVDYLEEALQSAGAAPLLASTPRRYEILFAAAASPGDGLVGRAWAQENGWAYRLTREGGPELFRGIVSPLL
jgi:acyl-CoA thioesterase FadM